MDYKKIYDDIINKRKNNTLVGCYSEKHHIIPRSLGGTDEKHNIVVLTAREHFICHLLLVKMYRFGTVERGKMVKALVMMKISPSKVNGRYVNSRFYEKLRIEFSLIQSELMTGKGNSQYNTRWIYSPDERISKKIAADLDIPEGWHEGRIIHFDRYCRKCNECGKEFFSQLAHYCSQHCRKTATLRNRKLDKHFLKMDSLGIGYIKGSVSKNAKFIKEAAKLGVPNRQILLYLGCTASGYNYQVIRDILP